jgi:hypothetical protein
MKKLQPLLEFVKAQKWSKPTFGEVTFPNVGTFRTVLFSGEVVPNVIFIINNEEYYRSIDGFYVDVVDHNSHVTEWLHQ